MKRREKGRRRERGRGWRNKRQKKRRERKRRRENKEEEEGEKATEEKKQLCANLANGQSNRVSKKNVSSPYCMVKCHWHLKAPTMQGLFMDPGCKTFPYGLDVWLQYFGAGYGLRDKPSRLLPPRS